MKKISRRSNKKDVQQLLSTVHDAFIPSPKWRSLAQQCIEYHLNTTNNNADDENNNNNNGYVVLHTRIEYDMMTHRCGTGMERNLTKIFDMLDTFLDKKKNNNNTYHNNGNNNGNNNNHDSIRPIRGTMIAVNRNWLTNDNEIQIENWNVLNQRSVSYNRDGKYSFDESNAATATTTARNDSNNNNNNRVLFECGVGWIDEAFYNNPKQAHSLPYGHYGDVLPAMINFWNAVQADIFVGVMKSSWSNDVWTTRYYQGMGEQNYQYTPDQCMFHCRMRVPKSSKELNTFTQITK